MPDKRQSDTLFSQPIDVVGDFCFDDAVVRVFPDMISRSVPGYGTVIAASGLLAQRYSQCDTNLYDLGCSLGATSYAMAGKAAEGCKVVAVDNSTAMLQTLEQILRDNPPGCPIGLVEDDICNTQVEQASVVTLNYTLQFIERNKRSDLLETVFNGMLPGGALMLSEKIAFSDGEVNGLFSDLHHDFKRANGYSEIEISQKREALDNVLVPETIDEHRQRLLMAGFARVETWFQCFNFVSLIALKE